MKTTISNGPRRLFSCFQAFAAAMTFSLCFALRAQGTTQFIGFEEYPVDALPSFIKLTGNSEVLPRVTSGPGAFEGQNYLRAGSYIEIESPNHQQIQSY